jgi:hypothetical protein
VSESGRARQRVHVSVVAVVCAVVAVALLLFAVGHKSNFQVMDESKGEQRKFAPSPPQPIQACFRTGMCSEIMSGTSRASYIITTSEDCIEAIRDYHSGTYDQIVTRRSDSSVSVELECNVVLDTNANFPVNAEQLPDDVLAYLQPTAMQQSDHPELIDRAEALVGEAAMEVQAVVAVLDWVRANIEYDESMQLDNDALSVYRNRSGVCTGFSNLAVALLRAVGIPARVQAGCVLWGSPHGGLHSWLEVYYPDVGWVPSDSQIRQNFVERHVVSEKAWEWCERQSTIITMTDRVHPDKMYVITTPYTSSVWPGVRSAFVPSWDRRPLQVTPDQLSFIVSSGDARATSTVEVENTECSETAWALQHDAQWVQVSPSEGATRTEVSVSVDTSSLTLGLHTAKITIIVPGFSIDMYGVTVPIKVLVVDEVYHGYLPVVSR